MITKTQAKAYASISLDLLYKMKTKVSPEILSDQMDLAFDLYESDEIEELYKNMIHNNSIINSNLSGKAYTYIVNFCDTVNNQLEMIRKFCKSNIEIGKIFITPPGENADKYYELIKEIRNKNLDILIINIFTIYRYE